MKIIYEFDPYDDSLELNLTRNASKNYNMVNDVKEYIRSLYKHDDRDSIPKDELIEKLNEITEDFEFLG